MLIVRCTDPGERWASDARFLYLHWRMISFVSIMACQCVGAVDACWVDKQWRFSRLARYKSKRWTALDRLLHVSMYRQFYCPWENLQVTSIPFCGSSIRVASRTMSKIKALDRISRKPFQVKVGLHTVAQERKCLAANSLAFSRRASSKQPSSASRES